MKTDDIENDLRNFRFAHLTASELAAYCDDELAIVPRAQAEAHLKQCFICARQVEQIREENEALESRATSPEDIAFVERLIRQVEPAQKGSDTRPVETAERIPWQVRLAEYLQPMVASLKFYFRPVRGGAVESGKPVWQWQSEDGKWQAYATMEKNADLIIHFSSNDPDLEGARLHVHVGQLNQEITLQRVSESTVYAQVVIPWPQRRGRVADSLSVEPVHGE